MKNELIGSCPNCMKCGGCESCYQILRNEHLKKIDNVIKKEVHLDSCFLKNKRCTKCK